MSLVGRLVWDEAKRVANLAKHGLDFADAAWVLASRYRLDVRVFRKGEERTLSYSYVMERLTVLLLVHVPRESDVRIVSFRYANEKESKEYYEWLEEEAPSDP
jgi:uncharacterized DUF497 family protein